MPEARPKCRSERPLSGSAWRACDQAIQSRRLSEGRRSHQCPRRRSRSRWWSRVGNRDPSTGFRHDRLQGGGRKRPKRALIGAGDRDRSGRANRAEKRARPPPGDVVRGTQPGRAFGRSSSHGPRPSAQLCKVARQRRDWTCLPRSDPGPPVLAR